ncbi:MAG: hypothetical protein HZY76_00275 [Anaerolineae bacterium]|nr:MAG: hypothetical protein HZY76_00275 [Anaerolineae bacterium]
MIAEQSPEKLAPDAVRNTNLKIGHMLPGRQDREALAAAMIMDEAQERFMGKLRGPGRGLHDRVRESHLHERAAV